MLRHFGRVGAVLVLVASAMTAAAMAPAPGLAATGDVGVLGCSNTAIATIGYHEVTDVGRLWFASPADNPLAEYWGQSIVDWADPDGPGRSAWTAFDAELAANPATTSVWFQVCVKADSPGTTTAVDAIVSEIRERLPDVTIYASPLDDTPSCLVGDPELSQDYVDHLVATGRAERGPVMRPLREDQVNGCHADEESRTLHGSDLAAFFDDGVGPPPAPFSGFVDVEPGSTFEADIAWLADEGITLGCNPPDNDRFCPDDSVSRGQMAAFLVRALGLPPGVAGAFEDDDGSVFEGDIDALAAAGITTGCAPSAFCPNDVVTRAQMATFLVNAYGWADGGGDDLFVDDDGVHELDIDVLGTARITLGCNPPTNDLYCPDDPVTRAGMAAFLHRAAGS